MEESIIYNLMGKGIADKWRDEAEDDELNTYALDEKAAEEELMKELPESCYKALKAYYVAIKDRMEYIRYNLNIKYLNFGIQLGMELQRSCVDLDE